MASRSGQGPDDALHHLGTIWSDGGGVIGDVDDLLVNCDSPYPSAGFTPQFDAIPRGPFAQTPGTVATGGLSAPSSMGGSPLDPVTMTGSSLVLAPAGTVSTEQTQAGLNAGFVIIANFDSSITSSTLAATIESAISAAINFYESAISNPLTISIDFGYGEINSNTIAANAISQSQQISNVYSYDTLSAALNAHDINLGASSLAASNPFGTGSFSVATVEAMALGLSNGTSVFAGYIGMSTTPNNLAWDWSTTNRAVASQYDAVGALEHEISEVMGRVANYPVFNDNLYTPLDLFRYSSAGTLASTGTTASYFSINDGTTSLNPFNSTSGNDPGDWLSTGLSRVKNDSYDAIAATGSANTVSATDLTVMEMLGYSLVSCFAAGTHILAASGETRVERLAIGDLVQTRFAGVVPIRWIGTRRIDCRRHPDPTQVWPIRIVADAFGAGRPHRDLFLSPDHAVAVDGALIPIRLLVNGASISQESSLPYVDYFHIELDRHDLLFANGLESESYLDTGNRSLFSNGNAPILLHPRLADSTAQHQRSTRSCLALHDARAQVEPVWRALAARGVSLGFSLPAIATITDPALCIVAPGRRIAPLHHDGAQYIFALPPIPSGARLRSRAAVPSALRPWLEDRRLLGVMVRRLLLRQGGTLETIAPDDPRLSDGWWEPEHDTVTLWRWTNGDAALPPTECASILHVTLGDVLPYPLAERPVADAAMMWRAAG